MASPHEKKLRVKGPMLVTANRLLDGKVVHRTAQGEWSPRLGDAEILITQEAAHAALAAAQLDMLVAVGPYLAPVDLSDGAKSPGDLRETIRANGPTFPLPVTEKSRPRPFQHTGAEAVSYA
jgi:hypothetical protein